MRFLSSLNPEWIGHIREDSGEGISFDCPNCGPSHRLAAYFSNPLDRIVPAPWLADGTSQSWQRIGEEFDTLTMHPSMKYDCFHGWVVLGVVMETSEAWMYGIDQLGRKVALSPLQMLHAQAAMAK